MIYCEILRSFNSIIIISLSPKLLIASPNTLKITTKIYNTYKEPVLEKYISSNDLDRFLATLIYKQSWPFIFFLRIKWVSLLFKKDAPGSGKLKGRYTPPLIKTTSYHYHPSWQQVWQRRQLSSWQLSQPEPASRPRWGLLPHRLR